jgi:hypothetical protein
MNEENQISLPDKIVSVAGSVGEKKLHETRKQLIILINELINNDFNALVQLLYRIDINEKKLKKLLKQNENADTAIIISDLIIERQLQKIESKKQFSQRKKTDAADSW